MVTPDKKALAPHLLVSIVHQEARVDRTEDHGAGPERIGPHDPPGYGKHPQSAQEWADGKRRGFYKAVAKALRAFVQVLLFGGGTGRRSEMDTLLAELKAHHPDVAATVVGPVVGDAHHTTEGQLLAKARSSTPSSTRSDRAIRFDRGHVL